MARIIEDGKKNTSRTGEKESNSPTANAGDHPQICSAISDEGSNAVDARRYSGSSIVELIEEGRRRIAAGEKVIAVIRWAVAHYPEKAIAIATSLAPSHAYGPGKSFDTAEQFGRHVVSTDLNKKRKKNRNVSMSVLKQMAEAGDEEARDKIKRRREAMRRANKRSRESGRRALILRRYEEKKAQKKAAQAQADRPPESHDGAQR